MVSRLTGVDSTNGQAVSEWARMVADSALPPNPTLTKLPQALAAAHEHYMEVHGVKEAVVVFIDDDWLRLRAKGF